MGRFSTAWKAFWSILHSDEQAGKWMAAQQAKAEEKPAVAAATKTEAEAAVSADAVYTLVVLQREGRLIDFLQENIDGFSDAQVGAAVRQIHKNCAKVLDEVFGVSPVRREKEGEEIEIPAGFDPRHIRVVGKSVGEAPFRGTLRHCGWRVDKVNFPKRHEKLDEKLIQAAEVEV